MAQVALFGHMKPKGQKAKARISKTISDHAVANTWVGPVSLPSWLTEDFYVQRILPLLRSRKVQGIAEAMKVSKPYPAFVRPGPKRSRPKHWEALAKLVGVQEATATGS